MRIEVDVEEFVHIDMAKGKLSFVVNEDELLREMGGAESVLEMMDYSEITAYVNRIEEERKEEDEHDRHDER